MADKTRILTDLSSTSRPVVDADDERHPVVAGDRYWAETTWWAFMNPADRLGGWLYILTRPELGVASLGVFLWDDGTRLEPWRLRYSKSFVHIPLPADYSLRDLRFPDHGFHLVSEVPLSRYRLSFDDGTALAIDLSFQAVLPPQPMGTGDDTGHFDQPMWASGTIELSGKTHVVDAAAFRDRTWSTRPETAHERANCYSWATSDDAGFQLLAMLDDDGDQLFAGGYVHRDGEVAPLTAVQRRVVDRDPVSDAPRTIEVDLHDAIGRTSHAVGRCLTTAALPGFAGYLTFASMVEWTLDGASVWGEDHDSWPHGLFVRRFG